MIRISIDMTSVDSLHRKRGIGRYAQGLMQGFDALAGRGELRGFDLKLLRAPHQDSLSVELEHLEFTPIERRWLENRAAMWAENLATMDRLLPEGTELYHGTGMEQVTRKTPWIPTCHDIIPLLLSDAYLTGPKAPYHRAWWLAYLRSLRTHATRVIAISEHVKQTLVDAEVPADKIDVIHHGLSPYWGEADDAFAPALRLRSLRQEPFILFVGGFDQRKNYDKVLEALATLPEQARPTLAVVGTRGKKEQRLIDAQTSALNVGASVRYLEYVDDRELRWLYRNCAALIFPSTEEGWGFPIVEAMAAGTCVICADFGSMSEAAAGAAMTIDVNDPTAIAHAMDLVTRDASRRMSHVELGIERARSLGWDRCAGQVLETYDRALA